MTFNEAGTNPNKCIHVEAEMSGTVNDAQQGALGLHQKILMGGTGTSNVMSNHSCLIVAYNGDDMVLHITKWFLNLSIPFLCSL